MRNLLALWLLLTLLPACRPAPMPSAPTVTVRPNAAPSATPAPTASPTLLPAGSPTPRPTDHPPTPTALPTASPLPASPTPVPTALATPPAGPARYIGAQFSGDYPAEWVVRDAAPNAVTLSAPAFVELTIGVYAPACNIKAGGDIQAAGPCLLERMRAAYHPRDEFLLLASGAHEAAGVMWFVAEYSLLDYISKQTRYVIEAQRGEAGVLLGCAWRNFAARPPDAAARATYWSVCASLQVAP